MRTPLSCTAVFLLTIIVLNKADSVIILPREPFDIHLANLSVNVDPNSGVCEKVRISYEDSKDQVIITPLDDIYVKHSRNKSEKIIYRENVTNAYNISSFELKHLELVNKSLLVTLEQLEKHLLNKHWEKCLFLDSYFPRFLRGYYFLINTTQSTFDALPESAKVSDSLFDISLNSLKSDIRINKWRSSPESLVKLRIATKELIYQIKARNQKIAKNEENDSINTLSEDFTNSIGLFVSIYFNSLPKNKDISELKVLK